MYTQLFYIILLYSLPIRPKHAFLLCFENLSHLYAPLVVVVVVAFSTDASEKRVSVSTENMTIVYTPFSDMLLHSSPMRPKRVANFGMCTWTLVPLL